MEIHYVFVAARIESGIKQHILAGQVKLFEGKISPDNLMLQDFLNPKKLVEPTPKETEYHDTVQQLPSMEVSLCLIELNFVGHTLATTSVYSVVLGLNCSFLGKGHSHRGARGWYIFGGATTILAVWRRSYGQCSMSINLHRWGILSPIVI